MSLTPGSHRRAAAVLGLLLCTACAASAPPASAPPASAPPDPGPSTPEHVTFFMDSDNAESPGPVVPFMSGAVTVQTVGAFQIVEEKDSVSMSQDVHGPYVYTTLRLAFSTADRLAYVLLEDNGGGVSINVRTSNCLSSTRYYQYRDREDETHLYEAMANNLDGRLSTCPSSVAAAERYRREFHQASPDFPAAIREFKSRVVAVFHALEPRCRTPEPEPTSSADLYRRCP